LVSLAKGLPIFYFLKKGQSGRNSSRKRVSWDISRWSLHEGTTKLPPSLGSLAPGMRAQHSPPSKGEQQRGGPLACLPGKPPPTEGERGDSSLQAGGRAAADSWGSTCILGSVLQETFQWVPKCRCRWDSSTAPTEASVSDLCRGGSQGPVSKVHSLHGVTSRKLPCSPQRGSKVICATTLLLTPSQEQHLCTLRKWGNAGLFRMRPCPILGQVLRPEHGQEVGWGCKQTACVELDAAKVLTLKLDRGQGRQAAVPSRPASLTPCTDAQTCQR